AGADHVVLVRESEHGVVQDERAHACDGEQRQQRAHEGENGKAHGYGKANDGSSGRHARDAARVSRIHRLRSAWSGAGSGTSRCSRGLQHTTSGQRGSSGWSSCFSTSAFAWVGATFTSRVASPFANSP